MKNNDKQKNNIEICYGTLIVVKKKEKKKGNHGIYQNYDR